MKNIPIIAKPDHLTSVTRAKNPLSAIAELIWNALDAEADIVEIETVENKMGGLEKIIVKDNGFGLPYDYAFTSFGSLGGSWKRDKEITDISHRKMHGQNGKGRFQAFSIGNCCDWTFTYSEDKARFQYTVSGQSSDLAAFAISDDKKKTSEPIGTIVAISDIRKDIPSLKRKHAVLKLAEVFALFLTRYPDIRIIYDGEPISPEKVKIDTANIVIDNAVVNDSYSFDAEITIIEWNMNQERSLVLCNGDGFALKEMKPRIQTPGCNNWTAYIKSDSFGKLDNENRLELEQLDSYLDEIVSLSRNKIRQHFRERESISTGTLIEEWKKEEVYPFDDTKNPVPTEIHNEIFDICAFNINSYLADFENSSIDNKKLTFQLLKELLERNPGALNKIFQEVLRLPKEKQSELEDVLNDTALSF